MSLKQLGIFGFVFALLGVAEPLSGSLPAEALAPPLVRPVPTPVPAPPPPSPKPKASGLPDAPPGYVYWKSVGAKVTAYDPTERCCGDSADGRTSLGDDAWVMDGVATAPEAIPYRTRLWVPGVGWREVDDTGSAMRRAWKKGQYLVDLRVPYYGQARRWGVRRLTLHLYRPEGALAKS